MKSFLSIVGATLLSGSLLFGANKVSTDLADQPNGARVKVIIQYKQAPTAGDFMALSLVGGLLNRTLSAVNLALATIPVSEMQTLANNPNVAYISPDRPLSQLIDYSAAAVNAQAAWNSGMTGAGIGVAVIDSGVAQVPDLGALGILPRVAYRENFSTSSDPRDLYGHGTHVAGIIGASGLESSCANCTRLLKGIAPAASIIDLKVLDGNGAGTDSAVLLAIDRAITLRKVFNIRVINLSLGRPVVESYKFDPLCQAVEAAWKAGITVVVAAGNDGRDNAAGNQGYGTIGSPANDPYVITVGAMKAMGTYPRTDDLLASYSSKGPSAIDFVVKPDLVAPGNQVVSLESANSLLAGERSTAVPLSYYEATHDNSKSAQFMLLNGTSMAAPVVSGAVADLLQSEPSLTPDQIKARLLKTAFKTFPQSSTAVDGVTGQIFTSYYDIFSVGAGYLDIAAALANHDVALGNALSPTATFNTSDGNVYLVFDPASTWDKTTGPVSLSTAAVWSAQTVWGTSLVSPNRTVWGDRTVWGNRTVWGSSTIAGFDVIWGATGVWRTETDQAQSGLQGTRTVWGSDATVSDSNAAFNVVPK